MRKLIILQFLLLCACTDVRPEPQASAEPSSPVAALASEDAPDSACKIYGIDPDAADIDRGVLSGFEGYSDTLYQPSDGSGPTIGFGLDLAHAAPGTIRYVLSGLLTEAAVRELLTAQGKTGRAARAWIAAHRDVHLDRCAASLVETRQYASYWRSVADGRPYLNAAPREVKTAVTSFVMHTGKVDPLLPALRAQDWGAVAERIRTFHDNWGGPESTFFQSRRAQEAKLINLRGTRGRIDYD